MGHSESTNPMKSEWFAWAVGVPSKDTFANRSPNGIGGLFTSTIESLLNGYFSHLRDRFQWNLRHENVVQATLAFKLELDNEYHMFKR